MDAGKTPNVQERGGEHRPGISGRDDRIGLALGDGSNRAYERRVGLRLDRFDGRRVHRDAPVRLDQRKAVPAELGGPHEDGLDLGGRSSESPGDDLVRSTVATQRVDGDPDHARTIAYGTSRRSGSTSRPLYVLQFGHTRCGLFGCLQVGQTCTRGTEIPCCARRLSRLDRDVFLFGTAMSGCGVYPRPRERLCETDVSLRKEYARVRGRLVSERHSYRWTSEATQGGDDGRADEIERGVRTSAGVVAALAGAFGVAALSLPTAGTPAPAAPPRSTSEPRIDGRAEQGRTLSASRGGWTGGGLSFAYRWVRCGVGGGLPDGSDCTSIAGATGSRYVVTSADVGFRLRVRVTATNSEGSQTVASNPTAAIVGPPVNTSIPVVAGTPLVDSTLTVSRGGWRGRQPIEFAYAGFDATRQAASAPQSREQPVAATGSRRATSTASSAAMSRRGTRWAR